METLKHQNESLIVVDMRDEKLVEILRQAITKGQEVCVVNFAEDYREEVKVDTNLSFCQICAYYACFTPPVQLSIHFFLKKISSVSPP